jgi:hypothetical protein
VKAACWIAAVLAAVVGLGWLVTGEGVIALALGWFSFLRRVLPQMRFDGESAVVGVTAFVLLTAGVHWLAHGIRLSGANGEAVVPWRFRWTAALVLMVAVAFAAGIAVVGVVHQVGWLANAEQPLLVETVGTPWDADLRTGQRMFALGALNFESARGSFPTSATVDEAGRPLHSWETQILPFLPYFLDIDRTKPWDDPGHRKVFQSLIPEFLNPAFRIPPLTSEDGYGLNHYSANQHLIRAEQGVRANEVTDGTTNTILFGEVSEGFSP